MTLKAIVARFSLLVLLFNGAWAAVALHNDFNYGAGLGMSLLLYSAAGFVAARRLGHRSAMLAGAAVASVEATLALAIVCALAVSSAIATIPLPPLWWLPTMALFAFTLPLVGAAFGALGALPVPARATRR